MTKRANGLIQYCLEAKEQKSVFPPVLINCPTLLSFWSLINPLLARSLKSHPYFLAFSSFSRPSSLVYQKLAWRLESLWYIEQHEYIFIGDEARGIDVCVTFLNDMKVLRRRYKYRWSLRSKVSLRYACKLWEKHLARTISTYMGWKQNHEKYWSSLSKFLQDFCRNTIRKSFANAFAIN